MEKTILALLLCAVLLFAGCAKQSSDNLPDNGDTQSASINTVTAQQAHERWQSGEPVVFVDVRTAAEYEQTHIPGAILLPETEIGDSGVAELPVLDSEIYLYGTNGSSAAAAQKLLKLGYTRLNDMGDAADWEYELDSGAWSSAEKDGTFASFTAYDLFGVRHDENMFSNSALTMLNVWATYCGPCLREMPDLARLSADYAARGVQVVGIVSDITRNGDGVFDLNQLEYTRGLVEQTGAGYTHIVPSRQMYAAALSDVSVVPTTFFVDSQGRVVAEVYTGSRSYDEWAQIIEELL